MKEQKKKKVVLLQRHKEALVNIFDGAVRENVQVKEQAFFEGFTEGMMASTFSAADLNAFQHMHEDLCNAATGAVELRNTRDTGSYRMMHVRIPSNGKRYPRQIYISAKQYDKADRQKRMFEDERQQAHDLARQVIYSCRTTEDLRQSWPQGEQFWKPMVERLEAESGVSKCSALIPVSQIKKLNQICSAIVRSEGAK